MNTFKNIIKDKENKKLVAFTAAGLVVASVGSYALYINSFLPLGIMAILSLLVVLVLPND